MRTLTKVLKKLAIPLTIFLAAALQGEEFVKAPSTNVEFPLEVSFSREGQEYTLHATGVATRSKFFVNVYSVAHYMRRPVHGRQSVVFDEILADNQIKQLTLKWVRDLDPEKIRDGFHKAIEKVLSYQPADIQSQVDTFLGYFNTSIVPGDVNVFRWFPGGIIEVEINGKQIGTITSPEFAKTLWSVYFGPKSVVSRNRLISLTKPK